MQQKDKKKKSAGAFILLAVALSIFEEIIGEVFGLFAGFLIIAVVVIIIVVYKQKNKKDDNNTSSYTYNYDDLKRDDLIEDYDTRQRNRCPECGYRIMPGDEKCGFCGKKVKYRG